MSIFNDKALKGVAEAAAKIMEAQKLAKQDYDKDGKIESPKAEVLGSRIRAAKLAGKLKEGWNDRMDNPNTTPEDMRDRADMARERSKNEPASQKSKPKSSTYRLGFEGKSKTVVMKKEEVELNEETEQLDEYESKGGKYTHKGTYGREKGAKYGESDYSKGGEEEKETEKAVKSPKRASKGYGARQNMGMRGQSTGEKKKKVNESLSFTEMLELYNEHGLKVLAPIETEEMDIDGTTVEVIDADKVNGVVETMVEEPDNETFTKEVEAQKAKNAGGGKKAEVAKPSVQAVEVQKEEVEQIDEISKELAGKYLTAPQGKGANKYKTGEGESTYPNWSALSKHQKNVKRALQRSGSSSLNKKPSYYKEDVEQLDEKLPASASAGDYIHDFVHSDNPKFAGKSTKERQKMALGAFYAKNKGK